MCIRDRGYEIGKSLVDDSKIDYCKEMMAKAEKLGKKLLLPVDAVTIADLDVYKRQVYAVLESLSRIVAAGGDYSKVRFTFQEYFRRMSEEPKRWSQPFAALLGAYNAQIGFGLPSIGGKDSMSGSFNEIDVPPTLVSFAVDVRCV